VTLPRRATAADAPALEEFRAHATSLIKEHRGGKALLADLPLERLLKDAVVAGALWVCEDALGLSGAILAWPEGAATRFALWVHPRARRQGRGRALARCVLDTMNQEGTQEIDALALPGDRAMKQLLESLGFKARLLVMRQGG